MWERWENGQVVSSELRTYTYDSNNNILSEKQEWWDAQFMYSGDKLTYTYDTQSNMTSVEHHVWLDSSWIPKDKGLDIFYSFYLNDSAGNEYLFFEPWNNITFIRKLIVTDIESKQSKISKHYTLSQNYPNPFNPSTTIKYQIPANVKSETANVKLIIFDVLGRQVASLLDENQKPGNYEVTWDAFGFSSGVYFYKFKAGNFVETKKMMLLK